VRCSSCEPLLAAYLEGTLRRRQALRIAEHLRGCRACESFLRELRVVDALLTTARPPGSIAPNFTADVLSATHGTSTRSPRRVPLLLPLLLYLVAAWALTALRSNQLLAIGAAFVEDQQRNAASLGAAIRAFAPATPVAAAAVTVVLLVDILLLAALFYGYRRVRPLLASYLERGRRA
jgi:anti-sigma factor RsiW